MTELEIISYALIALFLMGITSTFVGWRFIKKYEKLKLEVTTNKLEEFTSLFNNFIDEHDASFKSFVNNSQKQDLHFQNKKNIEFGNFLDKISNDYKKYIRKVDDLNNWLMDINTKLESRIQEYNALYPKLTETNRLLDEEDKKIKDLIKHQFTQLDQIQTTFNTNFSDLTKNLEEKTESTHKIHQDKIKEYSSELIISMKNIVDDIKSSHKTTIEEYRAKLIEHSSEAELKLKNAVKSHSLNKIEENLSTITITQNEIIENWKKLPANLQTISEDQKEIKDQLDQNYTVLQKWSENKGGLRNLFK